MAQARFRTYSPGLFCSERLMTTSAVVLAVIHVLNILAIITVIFFQRKESSTRFAWILVLALIPVGGFILYLFFGHDYRRRERLEYSEAVIKEVDEYLEGQVEHTRSLEMADRSFPQMAHMNLINAHSPLSSDNSVRVFTNGRDKFDSLLEDLRQARNYIHLLYFIFRTDELGREILDILSEKARAGLDVKVVYDDIGNLSISGRAFQELRRAGGHVFRYSPLFTGLVSANYRNHRKLAIIDGRIGYIGGMNIGLEYVLGRGSLTPWRDTHLRIEGSAAGGMEAAFLPDYVYAANKKDRVDDLSAFFTQPGDRSGQTVVQVVTSEPQAGRYHLHDAYAKMIVSAKNYLYIQTPYLVPDKTMLDNLRIALASGVDVRIMIPLHPDKRFVWYASIDYARFLSRLGARIYLYEGFIHSKVMMADDQVLSVGSANLDVRSFFLSYEANAFVFDEGLTAGQRGQFHADMEHSRAADEDFFKNLPAGTRFMMPLCRLFSPLL